MKKRSIIFIILLLVCIMSIAFGVTSMVGAESSAPSQTKWTITDFDSLNEFGVYDFQGIDNLQVEEADGRKYISGTAKAGVAVMQQTFDPIDLTDYNLKNVYYQISFYVEDFSALKLTDNIYGCLELTSSGGWEYERSFWCFEPNKPIGVDNMLKQGWNDWSICLGGAHRTGATPIKYDNINFARLYLFTNSQVKIAYDKVELVYIEDIDMPVDFGNETAKNFQAENATIVGGDKSSEVTLKQGDSIISSNKYNIAVSNTNLSYVNVNYTAENPEKILSATLTLGDGNNFLIYDVPVGEQVDFEKQISLYNSKSGYVDVAGLCELSIQFETSEETKIVINSLYVDTISKKIERAIDKIEDVTIENYLEKEPLFEEVELLLSKYREISGISTAHYTQVVYNYLKYDMLKEKLDYVRACVDNGLYMEMVIPDTDYKNGDTVEITLNVKNLTSDFRNDTYSLEFDEYYFEAQGSTTGKVKLTAGSSRTIKLNLLVLQGGFQSVKAVITSLDSAELIWREFVVVNDNGMFKGDSHTHSIESDGSDALEINYYTAVTDLALAFIYSTDHDANPADLTDINYAKKVLAAAGLEKFITIKGAEITGYVKNFDDIDYSLAGHMLYYNGNTFYAAPLNKDRDTNVYLYKLYMQKIYEEGGYSYIAHPRQGMYRFSIIGEDITRVDVYPDMTGFEIFNGFQYHGGAYKQWGYTLEAIELWDRYNITGRKKYFAIGNSDAHNDVDLGRSYTGYLLEDYSELAINNAIGSGHMYVSSGVDFLQCTLDGVQMSETVFATEEKDAELKIILRDNLDTIKKVKLISYEMNFSSKPEDSDAGYATREESVLYDDQNGEYNKNVVEIIKTIKVKPNRFYRIEATSTSDEKLSGNAGTCSVRYACSNPFWVMGEASSFTLDKESLNLNVGEWHKLEITQTDSLYDTVLYTSSAPDKVQVEVSGKVTVLAGCPDGVYTITAKTSSGSVVKTVSVTVGESANGENPTPPVKPDDKKEGCGGSVSGVSVTLALTALTLGVAIIFKRKKA